MAAQRLTHQLDLTSKPGQARPLPLVHADSRLHNLGSHNVAQVGPHRRQAGSTGVDARGHVLARDPGEHERMRPQHLVDPEVGRAQVEQPRDRGPLPTRDAGRRHGSGPAGRGDPVPPARSVRRPG